MLTGLVLEALDPETCDASFLKHLFTKLCALPTWIRVWTHRGKVDVPEVPDVVEALDDEVPRQHAPIAPELARKKKTPERLRLRGTNLGSR
jgi:hypothetical protein